MTPIRNRGLLARCMTLMMVAVGLSGAVQAQSRFTISADGQEVLDAQARLTWRRCAEGMNWNGTTCVGKATKFSYGAAKKQATNVATQSGQAWRLPAKDELLGIVQKGKAKPLIDTAAFPGTPAALFWATRPEVEDNLNAWIVNFRNGHVYGNTGSKAPHLRLVRTTIW